MKGEIILRVSKVKRKKKVIKFSKIALLIFLLLLLLLYIAVSIVYNSGNFTVTLDKNLYFERGIIIYDDPDYKVFRTELFAKPVDTMDNIYYKWLPNDLDDHDGGSHNGDNYVAYTFFIENMGEEVADYWSEIIIDDVIKNVDEAIRIRVYKNGNVTTYAKLGKNGRVEKDTIAFESDEVVVMDHVASFKPGDIDKYTIVLWIDGGDPECTDNILGGEIKLHMAFNSEFVEK
ncbi:MAG: hypothetical protein WDA21_04645 [Bacilli bacterium]